ncbi:MAG: histone deacetylase [Actinomycetota bacterium]|nr:histone deacetylase [Actinomycetota bacterium]
MKVFYSDHFVLPLPEGHRFPMKKYSVLRQKVDDGGITGRDELRVPRAVTDEEILRAHEASYLKRLVSGTLGSKEIRRIGFPWSKRMVERSRRASGGTLDACRAALSEDLAANLAGGTHHAFAGRGEGFCVLNDSAIAARALRAEGLVEKVIILDTDVHQGNGTASILRGDTYTFIFSIHGAKNYPFRKEESDLDVSLRDGADDGEFLATLEDSLERIMDLADWDLAIFLAGADPFVGDELGRLSVTREGLGERDRVVLTGCRKRNIPVAITMAGGYAQEVEDIHYQTIKRAATMLGESGATSK